MREAIVACDEKLGELAALVECEVSSPLPEAPKGQRNVGKNSPQFAVFETAWRFYGVDLGGVPGISAGLLCALISEVGTREQLLAAFPTLSDKTSTEAFIESLRAFNNPLGIPLPHINNEG